MRNLVVFGALLVAFTGCVDIPKDDFDDREELSEAEELLKGINPEVKGLDLWFCLPSTAKKDDFKSGVPLTSAEFAKMLQMLSCAKSLEVLEVHGDGVPQSAKLDFLSGLTNLKSLTIDGWPIADVADVPSLPGLERLELLETGLKCPKKTDVLPRFPSLRRIRVGLGDWDDVEVSLTPLPDDFLGRAGSCWVMAAEQAKCRIVVLDGAPWYAEWEGQPEPPEDYGIVWEWSPATDPGIPGKDVGLFANPDECKARDGGRTILMTASGGAFAAIDVDAKKAKCYGVVGGNPHSIDVLPDGRYVVASSDGNKLTLVDLDGHPFEPSAQIKKEFPLSSAHGVHWDAKRNVLWAIGREEVAKFRYDASTMELTKLKGFPLSEVGLSGGHDLVEGEGCAYSGPFGKDCLAFTTDNGGGFFNMSKEAYEGCSTDSPGIKSVAYDGGVGYLAVHPKEKWWTDEIFCRRGCEFSVYYVKGARFYKARYLIRKGK